MRRCSWRCRAAQRHFVAKSSLVAQASRFLDALENDRYVAQRIVDELPDKVLAEPGTSSRSLIMDRSYDGLGVAQAPQRAARVCAERRVSGPATAATASSSTRRRHRLNQEIDDAGSPRRLNRLDRRVGTHGNERRGLAADLEDARLLRTSMPDTSGSACRPAQGSISSAIRSSRAEPSATCSQRWPAFLQHAIEHDAVRLPGRRRSGCAMQGPGCDGARTGPPVKSPSRPGRCRRRCHAARRPEH